MPLEKAISTNLEALKRDRDRYVAFAFASSDMLIQLDENLKITYIDGATRGFLGEEAEHFLGRPLSDILGKGQETSWESVMSDIRLHGRAQQRRLVLTSNSFPNLPVAVSGVKLPGEEKDIYLSFTILRQEMNEEELAGRDLKTGLLNRGEYARRAAQRLRELVESGVEAKMSLLDLPDLKQFLDTLEPQRAKQLSREIADYLKQKSIGEDTAGLVEDGVYSFVHDDSVASEEVLDEVKSLLKKLDPGMANFKARLATIDGNVGHLNEEDSARAVLYTLNRFAASKEGFSMESLKDSYQEMLQETVQRITSFKTAVEDKRFELAFQPIVDLRNGLIHHYEALVRLNGEDQQAHFSNPFQFVNFGEQTGLINEFDLAMCRSALEVLNRAHNDSRWPLIAINLSGKSLSSQLFMDAMMALLEQYPQVRKQLIVEVTESAKISDMLHANRFLQELRKRGHTCCLDDFGVAESSFDYLRYLHVDYIKIDGSYVRENLYTTRGRHLLRAMVGMCRNLGMTTIAEMVEDKQTANILWESGVHYGQGWLFGKPDTNEATLEGWNLPCANFEGTMKNRNVEGGDSAWGTRKEG